MTCARAAPPRCTSRGLRAYQRVTVHVQGLACEQHTAPDTVAPKTQTTSPATARFQRSSPRWSGTLSTLPPQTVISPSPNGGNGVIRTTICRRRTASQPLMLQNSHCHRTITSNHSDTCPHIVVGGLTLRRRRPRVIGDNHPVHSRRTLHHLGSITPVREHYTTSELV